MLTRTGLGQVKPGANSVFDGLGVPRDAPLARYILLMISQYTNIYIQIARYHYIYRDPDITLYTWTRCLMGLECPGTHRSAGTSCYIIIQIDIIYIDIKRYRYQEISLYIQIKISLYIQISR